MSPSTARVSGRIDASCGALRPCSAPARRDWGAPSPPGPRPPRPSGGGLWNTIGCIIGDFTPSEYANYFAAAGNGPDPSELVLGRSASPRCRGKPGEAASILSPLGGAGRKSQHTARTDGGKRARVTYPFCEFWSLLPCWRGQPAPRARSEAPSEAPWAITAIVGGRRWFADP